MRKVCLLVLSACLVLCSGAFADDEPWAGFENCGICGEMCKIDGIFERVHCDTKIIENGMIAVSVVPEDMKAAMKEAHASMEAAIAKIMAGEKMDVCGFCESMGKLAESGAEMGKYDTDVAFVMLVTSDDPEVVKQIHAHAEKAIKMQKHMKEQMQHATQVSAR